MPEADAVYRTARRLDAGLAGRVLARTDFRVPAHATADLRGRSVLGTDTHGKHLLTRVESGTTLHTHLRMDGRWRVLAPGRRVARREQADVRVLLETEDGTTAAALLMPVVELLPTADEQRVVGHLGPDPLRVDWDAAEAVRRLSADPRRGLASALLDQRLMSGLGNLWVNELCFLRGHSPWTPVSDVDLVRTVDLAARMLRHSVEHSGGIVTTGDTRRGEQQWVAGRGGRPCRRCGTTVREVVAVAGDAERRRTCWCPSCQPGPGPDR